MVIIRFTIFFTIVLPWEKMRYLGILHGEVLQWWFCALAELIFYWGIRNANKHFWRLPGKQLAKDIVNSLINFTSLSPLILAGLPLLSLSSWLLQSSAWPVLTYQVTSIRTQKELGELWDATSSHLRKDLPCPLVYHPLQSHHPWPRSLFVSTRPRPLATFPLDWTKTKPAMTALSWRLGW